MTSTENSKNMALYVYSNTAFTDDMLLNESDRQMDAH